jgi:hypothetical protein
MFLRKRGHPLVQAKRSDVCGIRTGLPTVLKAFPLLPVTETLVGHSDRKRSKYHKVTIFEGDPVISWTPVGVTTDLGTYPEAGI